MPGTPRFRKRHVEEALRKAGGIKSLAAQILGCAPNTITNYMRRHPELGGIQDEITEENLDIAEAKLLTKIRSGNLTAVIFYLKTKGRARGYVERAEVGGPGGGPVQVETRTTIDVEKLTLDQRRALLAAMRTGAGAAQQE